MSAATASVRARNPLAEADQSVWKGLYTVAAYAALAIAVFIPIQIVVFIVWPPPATVLGYFTLYPQSPLLGQHDQDLLLVVDTALGLPILLALYVALRRANEGLMLLSLALGLAAVATYMASNTAVQMLTLSNQYALAAGEAERAGLLAAGQPTLANYSGTAFHFNYIGGALSLLIASVVMLRGAVFSRTTAWLGVVLNVLAFGLYVPVVGLVLSILSVVLMLPWYLLVARRLWQLR